MIFNMIQPLYEILRLTILDFSLLQYDYNFQFYIMILDTIWYSHNGLWAWLIYKFKNPYA